MIDYSNKNKTKQDKTRKKNTKQYRTKANKQNKAKQSKKKIYIYIYTPKQIDKIIALHCILNSRGLSQER